MKVAIIGHGVIGRAIAANVLSGTKLICDPAQPDTLTIEQIKAENPDIYFVAVGTPAREDGSCDTASLFAVMGHLSMVDAPVIFHSTAPPSFYADNARPHFMYIPEFVTAANAARDYGKQEYLIIGGIDDSWMEMGVAIMQDVFQRKFANYRTTPQTASFVKYMANTMLAMKVTYLNQCRDLADKLGVDWQGVALLGGLDERLGNTHWQIPGPDGKWGYGGMCFPKDVAAFIAEASALDVDFDLLEVTRQINLGLRERDGTRTNPTDL